MWGVYKMTDDIERNEMIKSIIEALPKLNDETLEDVYYSCLPNDELSKFLREAVTSVRVIIPKTRDSET